MKDEFEMYGSGIKPVKFSSTRWVHHQIRAMQRLVDRYRLYCQHLQHKIPELKKLKIVLYFKESSINQSMQKSYFDHAFL